MDINYSTTSSGSSTAGMVMTVIFFCFIVAIIVAQWILFSKAGEKPWKCLIPIYNAYIWVKIVMGNGVLFLLYLVPIVGFVFSIIVSFRTANVFGKGTLVGILSVFFGPIVQLYLAWSDAQYIGPTAE